MEITLKTKVNDLLKAYPQLEEKLISLNPKYKKLKNPILRRTVAKIASLDQVAKIGGFDPIELVNILREEVGQAPIEGENSGKAEEEVDIPLWVTEEPKEIINATELLDNEKSPLSESSKILKSLKSGEVLLVKSDFFPAPLVDTFKKEGHEVFSRENNGEFFTYIRRK